MEDRLSLPFYERDWFIWVKGSLALAVILLMLMPECWMKPIRAFGRWELKVIKEFSKRSPLIVFSGLVACFLWGMVFGMALVGLR